jgi:hypothetical protein
MSCLDKRRRYKNWTKVSLLWRNKEMLIHSRQLQHRQSTFILVMRSNCATISSHNSRSKTLRLKLSWKSNNLFMKRCDLTETLFLKSCQRCNNKRMNIQTVISVSLIKLLNSRNKSMLKRTSSSKNIPNTQIRTKKLKLRRKRLKNSRRIFLINKIK